MVQFGTLRYPGEDWAPLGKEPFSSLARCNGLDRKSTIQLIILRGTAKLRNLLTNIE